MQSNVRNRGDTSSLKVRNSVVDDGMSIDFAVSERIDTDAPHAIGRPRYQLCDDLELPFLKISLRVSLFKVNARRN